MITPTSIRDCMHRNPLTIGRDAPLVNAIDLLVEFKLTGLTVIDAEGSPCGKITELDCIRAVLNAIYNDGDPEHVLVSQAMTEEMHACSPAKQLYYGCPVGSAKALIPTCSIGPCYSTRFVGVSP